MNEQRFAFEMFAERHDLGDLQFDAAITLLKPSASGPWIVGGAVRRLIDRAPQDSDFDVACSSMEQLENTKSSLLAAGYVVKRETEAHVELKGKLGKNDGQLIQLLKMSFPLKPEDVIDTFDFTICQFAYDGTDIVCGQFSLWDLARKRLVLHKLSFGASTVRRMTKYGKQGYVFCQGTIVSILEAVVEHPETIRAEVAYVD